MDDSDKRPQLIRNCRVSESQTNTLLMPEGVMVLKGTAVEILKLCDGEHTIEEILSQLKLKFPKADPATIEAESLTFLRNLRQKRVMDFK